MSEIERTAILGAGVIGASWAALFLASGRSVTVFDPDPNAEASVRKYIEMAWPALEELGQVGHATRDAITFAPTAAEAVRNAQFIQENVPERAIDLSVENGAPSGHKGPVGLELTTNRL